MELNYNTIAGESDRDLIDVLSTLSDWEFVTEKREVTVWSKTINDDPISTFKGEGIIAKNTKEILLYLTDEKKRAEWDLFFENGGILKKINEQMGIVFYQTKSTYTTWPRDFTLLVNGSKLNEQQIGQLQLNLEGIELTDDNAPYLITGSSVEYEEREVPSSHVLGKVNRGGFLLVPHKIGANIHTKVTYVVQVDVGGWIPYSVMNMVNTYQPLGIIGIRKAMTGTNLPPT